ncbi:MAG: hypothetical protein PHC62_07870 [Candidatus Izemoplasmatales bacterium]|jgi:fatty acid desaturase|nr:hypothetical protein [Candidatus Izemoplasmatales bacterium]
MFKTILAMQTQKRYIIQGIIFFIFFSVLYFVLDSLNGGYGQMIENYGLFLVITNIFLNFFMSILSAFMMGLSTALMKQTGKEGKGTFLSSVAVFFGMLTYGCTPCVVTFFAAIGITFSMAVLPLAGLPYKFISLILLIIGYVWLVYEINHVKCKMPSSPSNKTN